MRTFAKFNRTVLRLGTGLATLVFVIGLTTPGIGYAQLRPNQPGVLEPPPPPGQPPVPDFAGEFRQRYVAAGSPRMMLFWNVELSDRARADLVVHDNDTKSGSTSANVQGQTLGAWDARMTTINGGTQVQSNRQRELSVGERRDAKRASLSPRDASVFERAFESEIRNAGVRLIDRNMAVRSTATEKVTDGQQQLEAEALRGKADLLLQVLFIVDAKTPLGYGFDVSVRDVANGIVLTSFYTSATPPPPPPPQGYVATDKGFAHPAQPALSLDDVARELAYEIMNQVGPQLTPAVSAPTNRK